MSVTDRVVVLVDMDCFYCQVEQKLDPTLVGKPLAVVQYNAWKGGGLIAVNYEARAKGVTRHMRGDDARAKCPEIELARVPTVRGKADLTRYREAGKQVAEVLQSFTSLLERASIDEAYLDITESVNRRMEMCLQSDLLKNSYVVGFDSVDDFLGEINHDRYLNDCNVKLAIGGAITEEIRAAVYEKTGYRCSAGVAHNKILAKLTAGLHKPNKQTILPHESVPKLYEDLSIKKIRSMGGKFGDDVMEKLDVSIMADLLKFSEHELQQHFDEKAAKWLYNIARGINEDPVTVRLVSKSIGCCKRFPGRSALTTEETVRHWVGELATEISERIEKDIDENNRKPKQLIVSYSQQIGRKDIQSTRSHQLNSVERGKMYEDSYKIIKKNCQRDDGSFCVKFLGLNVGKFEDIKQVTDISTFFKNIPKRLSNQGLAVSGSGKLETQDAPIEIIDINEKIKQVSNQLKATVNESIELNKSYAQLGDTFIINKQYERTEVSEIIRSTTPKTIVDNDDSESELEAINSSVNVIDNTTSKVVIKNSFFHNFLNTKPIPKRDFNTSMILNELCQDDTSLDQPQEMNHSVENERIDTNIDSEPSSPIIQSKAHERKCSSKTPILGMFSGTNSPNASRQSCITDDNKELCTECNKLIPVENIVSHMDYHFAIKMVRDEAYLYKQSPATALSINKQQTQINRDGGQSNEIKNSLNGGKSKGKNNNNGSSTKRKRNTSGSHFEITNFFNRNQQKETTDENTEICPDCSKRIKLDEFETHLDYHVAKKVQQEINKMEHTNSPKLNNFKSCASTKNKSKSKSGNTNIATYFKKT